MVVTSGEARGGEVQMMGQWFSPNIIGGAQERVPGGLLGRHRSHVSRKGRLIETLGAVRDEVARAAAVRETYETAADFADLSIAIKDARAAVKPKAVVPRPDKQPLDAFFERQAKTTNEQIGAWAEWDEQGDRVLTMTRMPRMPDLRHRLKIGELDRPLSKQQLLSTNELKRQAFEQASIVRNAEALAKRRAVFTPVASELRPLQVQDIAANPRLANSLRALRNRVELVNQERAIIAILDRQPKTSAREHGEWWLRQRGDLKDATVLPRPLR